MRAGITKTTKGDPYGPKGFLRNGTAIRSPLNAPQFPKPSTLNRVLPLTASEDSVLPPGVDYFTREKLEQYGEHLYFPGGYSF